MGDRNYTSVEASDFSMLVRNANHSFSSLFDSIHRDPFQANTRRHRKSLLVVSLLGFALIYTGITPTKITNLGIDFSPGNQQGILTMFSMLITYFLILFFINGVSDFVSWKLERRSKKEMFENEITKLKDHLVREEFLIGEVYRENNPGRLSGVESLDGNLRNRKLLDSLYESSEDLVRKVAQEKYCFGIVTKNDLSNLSITQVLGVIIGFRAYQSLGIDDRAFPSHQWREVNLNRELFSAGRLTDQSGFLKIRLRDKWSFFNPVRLVLEYSVPIGFALGTLAALMVEILYLDGAF